MPSSCLVTGRPGSPHDAPAVRSSLAAYIGYFLHLGAVGFGGPIALSARMQRDLVEKRGCEGRLPAGC